MWAVRVVATGANGFTTEASAGFQTDASAPVFTVTQPAVDAVMDDRFVTITGTAEPRTQLTLYVDNIEVATFNTYENSDWTHPLTSALENGDHTLFVIARDAAGNSADLTVPFKVLWYDELNGGDGGSGDFNGAEVNERSDGCAGGNEGPMGAWLLMLGAVLVLVRRRRHG
jgi:MYXO-CTERM domain-containing protein